MWAVACLQLGQPSQAKSGLNACLQAEPEFAWLYLLRGFASYQLAVRAGDLIEKLPLQADVLRAEAEFQLDAAAADYRRAGELLDEKPNDELRYALYVNRGLLGLERRDFQTGGVGPGGGDPAQRPPARGLCRAGAGLPEAGQARRVHRAVQPSHRASSRTRRRCIAVEPTWSCARKELDPGSAGAVPWATWIRRSGWRSRTTRCWRVTTPIGAGCWPSIIAMPRPWRPGMPRSRSSATMTMPTSCGSICLLKLKRYDDVIRSCDALIARGKATPAIYELRGLARAERKDFAGAIEDVTNAMALRPDRAALLSRRGWLYIVSDAPRLALHDFEAAIRLDPCERRRLQRPWFRTSAPGRASRRRRGRRQSPRHSASRPRTCYYNAARVYALAAVVAAAEVRKKGQDTVTVVARYQDRATELLREALKRMPEDQRASFWRDVVPADPALRVLRRRVSALDGSADVQKSSVGPGGERVAEGRVRALDLATHIFPLEGAFDGWPGRTEPGTRFRHRGPCGSDSLGPTCCHALITTPDPPSRGWIHSAVRWATELLQFSSGCE